MLKEFFSGFKAGFKEFSHSIAAAVNAIVLTIVYFLGVGVVAVFSRVFGKKFLPLEKKESYWVKRNLRRRRLADYKKTF